MENRRRDHRRSRENHLRRDHRRSMEDRHGPVTVRTNISSAPQFYQPIVPPLIVLPRFPCLGSCYGCFRTWGNQPLSEFQRLEYPWGGNTGAGMRFLAKYGFEMGERFNEDMFYFPGEKRKPNTYETIIRFLKQVRESKGYDVDCFPPSQVSSPFIPIDPAHKVVSNPGYYERRVLQPALYAVEVINNSMGNHVNFKLERILKAVDTINMLVYLTFIAKDRMDYLHTFQAMLYVPFGGEVEELWEWRFKPDFA